MASPGHVATSWQRWVDGTGVIFTLETSENQSACFLLYPSVVHARLPAGLHRRFQQVTTEGIWNWKKAFKYSQEQQIKWPQTIPHEVLCYFQSIFPAWHLCFFISNIKFRMFYSSAVYEYKYIKPRTTFFVLLLWKRTWSKLSVKIEKNIKKIPLLKLLFPVVL